MLHIGESRKLRTREVKKLAPSQAARKGQNHDSNPGLLTSDSILCQTLQAASA